MIRDNTEETEKHGGTRGWLVVVSLALAFLLYGIFMFVMVGDKGPPDWDFNIIEDIPGKSVYSTSPEPGGNAGQPEGQHVSGRPSLALPESEGVKK